MKLFIIFGIFIVTLVAANPAVNSNDNTVQNISRNQLEEGFLRKLNTKCSQRDNHSCMMLKLIVYMNRIFKKSSITISENLEIAETGNPELPNDPEDVALLARSMGTDDEAVGVIIAEKIWKFIRSRQVRYHIAENTDFVLTTEPKGNLNMGFSIKPFNGGEEGRGKMKHLGPMMAMMATKMGILGALFIKGLILLTGKALIVSKIALLLAVIIGLKKLLSKKHVTYEVVAHPHHHETAHSHDTYSSGWSRALDSFLDGVAEVPEKILDSQDLAYGGQKPQEKQ